MRPRRAPAADPAEWRAWTLVYHEDRDRLLREMVRPAVAALAARGDIRGFYFVRYNLGGPHVRLRLYPRAGRAARVDAWVRGTASAFFEQAPSLRSVPEEAILRQNMGIVATDPAPGGGAEEVFPDNSVRDSAVFFEVERYGGPGLLPLSLKFFGQSSAAALRVLADPEGCTPARRLSAATRLCIRQAWGFVNDGDEFTALLEYASALFPSLARFVERGNEAYERQRDGYCRLLRDELEALAGGATAELAGEARRLARALQREGDAMRMFVARSQLHMTANRLGMLNPEELYLGRILQRAAEEVAASDPAWWRGIWSAHRRRNRIVRRGSVAEIS